MATAPPHLPPPPNSTPADAFALNVFDDDVLDEAVDDAFRSPAAAAAAANTAARVLEPGDVDNILRAVRDGDASAVRVIEDRGLGRPSSGSFILRVSAADGRSTFADLHHVDRACIAPLVVILHYPVDPVPWGKHGTKAAQRSGTAG